MRQWMLRVAPALNFTIFFSLFAVIALLYIMTTKRATLMCETAVIVRNKGKQASTSQA